METQCHGPGAVLVSGMVWLEFSTVGGSGDFLSFYTLVHMTSIVMPSLVTYCILFPFFVKLNMCNDRWCGGAVLRAITARRNWVKIIMQAEYEKYFS